MQEFNMESYCGLWYELAHYPSWFQGGNTYNTTACYSKLDNQTIKVVNKTIVNGIPIESCGKAVGLCGKGTLHVSFPDDDLLKVNKFMDTGMPVAINEDPMYANYVIDKIWRVNCAYMYAIVTDQDKKSLWVLSRTPRPDLCSYNEVMKYVSEHYDQKLVCQTPHY